MYNMPITMSDTYFKDALLCNIFFVYTSVCTCVYSIMQCINYSNRNVYLHIFRKAFFE